MATKWVRPWTVSGYGTGTGNDYDNAMNGLLDLSTNIGTKSAAGDIINLVGYFGPADYSAANWGKDASDLPTSVTSVNIGSNAVGSSTASGRTLQLDTSYGRAVLDPRGCRIRFGFTLQLSGQNINLLGGDIYANDYSYMRWYPSGTLPQAVAENRGLSRQGFGGDVSGMNLVMSEYCSRGIDFSTNSGSTSRGLVQRFLNNRVTGPGMCAMRFAVGGATYPNSGFLLQVYGNTFTATGTALGNNQVNCILGLGGWGSKIDFYDNYIATNGQDCVDANTVANLLYRYNTVYGYGDRGIREVTQLNYISGNHLTGDAVWQLAGTGVFGVANGLKLGLLTSFPAYSRVGNGQCAYGNTVSWCGYGITNNGSPGGESAVTPSLIQGNLVTNCYLTGIINSAGGFYAINNNTVIDCSRTGLGWGVLQISGPGCEVYNNIVGNYYPNGNALVVQQPLVGGNNRILNNGLTSITGAGSYSPSPIDTVTTLAALGIDPNTYRPLAGSAALGSGTFRGYGVDNRGRRFRNPPSVGAFGFSGY